MPTTLKAEERSEKESGEPKAEGRKPDGMVEGEKEFLATLIRFMRGLKRSENRAVAKAARDWEGTIAYRIQLTMQQRERRTGRGLKKMEGGSSRMELEGSGSRGRWQRHWQSPHRMEGGRAAA